MQADTLFKQTVLTQKPIKGLVLSDKGPKEGGRSGAVLATYANGVRAVLKIAKKTMPNGKPTQRGLSVWSQPCREVAYYKLAEMIGWHDLVPCTVLLPTKTPISAQRFVLAARMEEIEPRLKTDGDPNWHKYLVLAARRASRGDWLRLVILDLIAGHRDRHANNAGMVLDMQTDEGSKHPLPRWKPIAWDNATSQGADGFSLYRSVYHRDLFTHILDLEPHWDTLRQIRRDDVFDAGSGLLDPVECAHNYRRLEFLRRYPYRLPWAVMSQGRQGKDAFPSYASFFSTLTSAASAATLRGG
jgi:hypothetical protein